MRNRDAPVLPANTPLSPLVLTFATDSHPDGFDETADKNKYMHQLKRVGAPAAADLEHSLQRGFGVADDGAPFTDLLGCAATPDRPV